VTVAEADLGMFAQTGARRERGSPLPHRPENVVHQHDSFRPVGTSL